jgi:hypothetical protein
MGIKFSVVIIGTISLGIIATISPAIEEKKSIGAQLSGFPLLFTENKGQWPDSILYRSSAMGFTMWFKQTGVCYQFKKKGKDDFSQAEAAEDDELLGIKGSSTSKSVEFSIIEAEYVGAEIPSAIEGIEQTEYRSNYFLGNKPNQWQTSVPSYKSLIYHDIYPGIDLRYHANGRQMEYDFVVSPGADYSKIGIRYKDAESLAIGSSGELVIKIPDGEIVEKPPDVFQYLNGQKVSIECRFSLIDDRSFGFAVEGKYSPANELIIDPVLVYSSYLGGLDYDGVWDIAVDEEGAAYITGVTYSHNFPVQNPFQSTYHEGYGDAFITKVAGNGSHLTYSTFFGGTGLDQGHGIAVDSQGAVYVAGQTGSPDFPLENALQDVRGGYTDAFFLKLNNAGNSLLLGTYLGGSADEIARDLTVDDSGHAYIVGETTSSDFPIKNAIQPYNNGGRDAFVAKFPSTGDNYIYSTYIGGASADISLAVTVDATGAAYMTGQTESMDFPTFNPFQSDQLSRDAFVTKISDNGANLLYSTYLGGSGLDYGLSIDVESNGIACISGMTTSLNFPTVNPYQNSNKGDLDILIAKLSAEGNNLIYSTYLGGSSNDYGRGIKIDASGSMTITGETYSDDFPILDEIQSNQPGIDGYVAKLSNSGIQLLFGTYLGGSGPDYINGMALDNSGAVYVVGYTQSNDYILQHPFQDTFMGGDFEGFVSKISTCCNETRGDLDNDQNDYQLSDLMFIVDRIFQGGPASICPEEADVNSDGTPSNILDLTFLVDRIFRGGPPPGPC